MSAFEHYLLKRHADCPFICPTGAIDNRAADAEDVRHVRELSVCLMHCAVQAINQHPAVDVPSLHHVLGVGNLVLDRFVAGILLARMRFPNVDEQEVDPLGSKFPCQRLHGWRRQPAVWSSYGSELDHQRRL